MKRFLIALLFLAAVSIPAFAQNKDDRFVVLGVSVIASQESFPNFGIDILDYSTI